jgi:peroxiredoxin
VVGTAYGACESADDGYPRRYTFVIGPDATIEQAIDTQDPAGQAAKILESM